MDRRIQRCEKGKCMQGPGGFPERQTAPRPGGGHEDKEARATGKITGKSPLKVLSD